jgi:large subunit ribosomal protein L30
METEKKKPNNEKPGSAKPTSYGRLAVVLVRNTTAANQIIRDTLTLLRLHKKFTCRVLDNNKLNKGMLTKVKDYTTFGEIDPETEKLLEQKRGKKDGEGKPRKDFHLSPPRGGFERKGIKHSFEQGGALGYRGTRMSDLIKKMI